jgi:PAS domain S-box-containing protein
MQARIEQLERMFEDRTREVYLANEKLQAAAEFLREVYKTMPGALIVFEPDGTVEAVNDAALAMLEYTRDEIVDKPVSQLFAPDTAPEFAEIASLAGARGVLRTEKTCRTRSGELIPVLFSATMMRNSNGGTEPRGVICVATDLRERKLLELELRQAQKLESVGRLAAGIAHEINSPIQYVADSVQFVRDAMTDLASLLAEYHAAHPLPEAEEACDLPYVLDNAPRALDRALEGLDRVASIVRSMKEFAHPDQRDMAPADIDQAIVNTLTIARNEYRLVADAVTELGDVPLVVCHGGEINQVLLNLVVNAAQAIGDVVAKTGGRGTITVRTREHDGSVVISITDTGGGIPPEIRERIYDPFFTTRTVGRGSGQGLAIARSVIVDKHGGDLAFETEVGVGTTFFVRLPISR